MPLLAQLSNGGFVAAPLLSDAEWQSFRGGRKGELLVPGTDIPAIPKVSPLGTRFFSRKAGRGGDGETWEHLSLKALALMGAADANWDALPEQTGRTPDGQEWRADVLCRRPGMTGAVAFEVQWSRQDAGEFERRQKAYAESGVRCLWLSRRSVLDEETSELPLFTVSASGKGAAAEWRVSVAGQEVPVREFATGALTGRLKWIVPRRDRVRLEVSVETDWCGRCHGQVVRAMQGVDDFWNVPGFRQGYEHARKEEKRLVRLWVGDRSERIIEICPHCNKGVRGGSSPWGYSHERRSAMLASGKRYGAMEVGVSLEGIAEDRFDESTCFSAPCFLGAVRGRWTWDGLSSGKGPEMDFGKAWIGDWYSQDDP